MKQVMFIVLNLIFISLSLFGQKQTYFISENKSVRKVYESLSGEGEQVLVVYNTQYKIDQNNNGINDGYEIAEYYAKKRSVPAINILGISTSTSEEINRSAYDAAYDKSGSSEHIKQDIEFYLANTRDENGVELKYKIRFILLIKGIPLKINAIENTQYNEADYASVDASLTMLFQNYDIKWRIDNYYFMADPLFDGMKPFVPFYYSAGTSNTVSYLVTRLDGFSVQTVLKLVDRSLNTSMNPNTGYFVLDDAEKEYTQFSVAADQLKRMGAKIYPDPFENSQKNYFTAPDSIYGYVGHGTYANIPANYIDSLFKFKYANGSLFSSYESFNGSTFRTKTSWQGLIAQFLEKGGSGAIGNVFEPWSAAIPVESILFPSYYKGYTFAEAAYQSLRYIDFTSVVVGDPLMKIAPLPYTNPNISSFRIIETHPKFDENNTDKKNALMLTVSQNINDKKLPEFYLLPDSVELKAVVRNNNIILFHQTDLSDLTEYKLISNGKLFSVTGDSLDINNSLKFVVRDDADFPYLAEILSVNLSGKNIDPDSSLEIIFSKPMIPETIYPIHSNPEFEQKHTWSQNNYILNIDHFPFPSGKNISISIDDHAASSDSKPLGFHPAISFSVKLTEIADDIDGDGYQEKAINADNLPENGYEKYADNNGDLTHQVISIDLENDGKTKFLIAKDSVTMPFVYWNPDLNGKSYINLLTEIDDNCDGNKDGLFDPFEIGYNQYSFDSVTKEVRKTEFNAVEYSTKSNTDPSVPIKLNFTLPVSQSDISNFISITPNPGKLNIYFGNKSESFSFIPEHNFLPNTEYSVTIYNNLESVSGLKLKKDYTFNFKTAVIKNGSRPFIKEMKPDTTEKTISPSSVFSVLFSRPMKTDRQFFTLKTKYSDILHYEIWKDEILFILPASSLPENEIIYLMLDSLVESFDAVRFFGQTHFKFKTQTNISDNQPLHFYIPDAAKTDTIFSDESIRFILDKGINTIDLINNIKISPDQPYSIYFLAPGCFDITPRIGWKALKKTTITFPDKLRLVTGNEIKTQGMKYEFFPVLSIISNDVDQDGYPEFAIDKDRKMENGFETFLDTTGTISKVIVSGKLTSSSKTAYLIAANSDSDITDFWLPDPSNKIKSSKVVKVPFSSDIIEYDVEGDLSADYQFNKKTKTVSKAILYLKEHSPENGSTAIQTGTPLLLTFNTAVNLLDLILNVRISPAVNGKWESQTPTTFRFTPDSTWAASTVYKVTIMKSLKSIMGTSEFGDEQFIFETTGIKSKSQIQYRIIPPSGNLDYSNLTSVSILFNTAMDTSFHNSKIEWNPYLPYLTKSVWINDSLLEIQHSTLLLQENSERLLVTGTFRSLDAHLFEDTISVPYSPSLVSEFKPSFFDEGKKIVHTFGQMLIWFNDIPDSISLKSKLKTETNDTTSAYSFTLKSFGSNWVLLQWRNLSTNSKYKIIFDSAFNGIQFQNTKADTLELQTESILVLNKLKIGLQRNGSYAVLNWINTNKLDKVQVQIKSLNSGFEYSADTFEEGMIIDLSKIPDNELLVTKVKRNFDSQIDSLLTMYSSTKPQWLISSPLFPESFKDSSFYLTENSISVMHTWNDSSLSWTTAFSEDQNNQFKKNLENATVGFLQFNNTGKVILRMSKPDSISTEIGNQSNGYSPWINYQHEVTQVNQLNSIFKGISSISYWDNSKQKWNEATYLSKSSEWINGFDLKYLQGYFIQSDSAITIIQNGEIIRTQKPSPSIGKSFSKFQKNNMSNNLIIESPYDSLVRAELLNSDNELLASSNQEFGNGIQNNRAFFNLGNCKSIPQKVKVLFHYQNQKDYTTSLLDLDSLKSEHIDVEKPVSFSVGNGYPNPFNPTINFQIEIPEMSGNLNIRIFNMLGQLVYSESPDTKSKTKINYSWHNSGSFSSGVYLFSFQFKNQTQIRKAVLVK